MHNTTLLNALGNETNGTGRMIVIEQTRELKLPDLVPLCVSLEAQEENAEGVGEIEQRELVRNALRMRPRRIIVGETRGAETWDMLRAMNTGHGGCLSSVHANSPRDALDALITLGMMAPERPPEGVMARLIARSISLVIQMAEEPGTGRRLLTNVFEITGLEGNTIQGHDLWLRDEVSGRLEWTGTPPKCMAEFARKGVPYMVPSGTRPQWDERGAGVIPILLVLLFALGAWFAHEAWTTPVNDAEKIAAPSRRWRRVQEFLHRAGLHDVTPRDFVLFSLGAGAWPVPESVDHGLAAGQPVAAGLGAGLPFLWYANREDSRRARVQAELADAMGLLRDSIRAGGDVAQGLIALATYGPALLKPEFQRAV